MTDTHRVIAIDPGQRTGWASADITDGLLLPASVKHGVLPLKEMALQLTRWQGIKPSAGMRVNDNKGPRFDYIAYEQWTLFASKAQALIGDDFQPSQQIGQIRLIAWLSGAKLKSYQPVQKEVFQASMPPWLADRKKGSNEEHDKDAIDLLWGFYFTEFFDPTKEPA